jgi:hypothetical protein
MDNRLPLRFFIVMVAGTCGCTAVAGAPPLAPLALPSVVLVDSHSLPLPSTAFRPSVVLNMAGGRGTNQQTICHAHRSPNIPFLVSRESCEATPNSRPEH